ncbi:hypothetical protein AB0G02_18925 [Actinosynnema sp. NPDC023658]|uniref:hypothetical protein n=1 Tax=Actinosynnema sp. NPDC023658 TaxID=3155465 RepID=UPI0033D838ED
MSEERLPLQSTDLTVMEQEVVDAARRGVWAGPESDCPTDLAVAGDAGLHVRAGLIRELLMGLHPGCWTRGYAAWVSVAGVEVRLFS